MEVKHDKKHNNGVFYMEENGQRIATLTYFSENENQFTIEHTVVAPGNEGKGLGKQLVDAVVAFARENGFKIVPQCPYARKVMERSDTYKDVLA